MTNNTDLERSQPADDMPSAGARPPLRRYDGVVGGVATGVAAYLGAAPWVIRLAFVVLSFFGGLGILLYLAGWLLIPAEDDDLSIAAGWLADMGAGRSWIGAALVAVAVIWLLTSLDIARAGIVWAVALLALGVLLYREELPPQATVGDEPIADEPPSPIPEDPGAPLVATAAPRSAKARRIGRERRSRPRRVRTPSMLGRFTVAGGFIGIGGLALLDSAGVLFPDVRHYLALAVAITGMGLLVGSVWGRSRVLIAVGLLLAFLMGIASIGEAVEIYTDEVRTFTPSSIEQVSSVYSMDSGTLIIDLTGVDWRDEETAIDADLGAGQLVVELPADVSGTITARAGVGQVEVLGRSSEGLGVGRSVTIEGPPGSGTVSLSVRVGAGQIIVTQEAS